MDLDQAIMHAKEPVDGRLARAYVTIDGNRYMLFQLVNFDGKDDIESLEIPVVGTTSKKHRSGQINGTWSAEIYYNTDIFRELAYRYRKENRVIYFDIQTTNDDPNSSAGRHTVIYKDCLMDSTSWSKIDIENPVLKEEVSGTYEDIELPERFRILEGMQ